MNEQQSTLTSKTRALAFIRTTLCRAMGGMQAVQEHAPKGTAAAGIAKECAQAIAMLDELGNKPNAGETLSALDAEFFHALDRCDTQEPLKVYDSNSWRRIGLANSYKTVVYPETQKYDGHLNIANTGVLCALVAAFNAMLARRPAQKAEVQRHSRDCDCHDCHYAKKHPQVKPHHARCGCFECAPNG